MPPRDLLITTLPDALTPVIQSLSGNAQLEHTCGRRLGEGVGEQKGGGKVRKGRCEQRDEERSRQNRAGEEEKNEDLWGCRERR
ncbi:hypothetical protein E2C01_081889 [Portunus trituberculatus]|uniref:Uncharacterized protein n=1 Tax=Portunus trituberculatus TaxID=210409 RepID=A0A5B7INJ4_PORTR|nr:hypothetical protein [Portunus trituberculatus]